MRLLPGVRVGGVVLVVVLLLLVALLLNLELALALVLAVALLRLLLQLLLPSLGLVLAKGLMREGKTWAPPAVPCSCHLRCSHLL